MRGKLLLSVATAALIVTGFTGCDAGKSTSVNSGQLRQIHAPKGTVTGVVTDTNGNPIADANVSLAGQKVSTDASGTYVFKNVSVVNASAKDGSAGNGNLVVVIQAPKGYLGATVTVTPQAQINSSEGTGNANSTSTGEQNPNTVFIDGFTASAGQVALPRLDANVKGVLRDSNTQAAIPATEVALDFLGVKGVSPDSNINKGIVISYATPNFKTVTDANGTFEFTNLPADSGFNIVVPGYTNIQPGTFNTDDEVAEEDLGNVKVTAITAKDTMPPYVTKVENELSSSANPVVLDDNTYNNFTIDFSEAINTADINKNSILIYNETNQTYIKDFTYNAQGNKLTVNLPQDLAPGVKFDIYLLKADFQDMAGNYLAVNTTKFKADSNASDKHYVKIALQTFKEANIATTTPTLTQTAEDKDYAQDETLAKLRKYSSEFKDNNVTSSPDKVISQLNDANSILLTNLAQKISGDNNVNVNTKTARVEFDINKAASSYNIKVQNSSGKDQNVSISLPDGTNLGYTNDKKGLDVNSSTTNSFTEGHNAIIISNVKTGDKVIITPKDDLNNIGTPAKITLKDDIAPIPVLQDAFGINSNKDLTTYQASDKPAGDGGELFYEGKEVKIGTPYLSITAGLLDQNKDHTISAITKYNTKNIDTDSPYVKSKTLYDANAFANAPKARVMGVGFAEPIDLNGTPAFNGATELSAWKAVNDLTQDYYNDKNPLKTKDEAVFNVANIFSFANADNNKIINFANIVSDQSGNVATPDYNPEVIVHDKMPPMVTYSFLDLANGSSKLKIKFDEPIQLNLDKTNPLIGLNGHEFYYIPATKKYVTLSADKKELSIDLAGFEYDQNGNFKTVDLNLNDSKNLYAESAYGTDKVAHFDLNFSNVKDVAGNDWEDDNSTIYNRPQFLSANSWAIFDSNAIPTHFNSGDDTTKVMQTVTWKLTHPALKSSLAKLCDNGKLTPSSDGKIYYCPLKTGVEVDNANGTKLTDLSEGNLTVSSDFRTLNLNFKTKQDVTNPNAYVHVTNNNGGKVTSEIDSSTVSLSNVEAK